MCAKYQLQATQAASYDRGTCQLGGAVGPGTGTPTADVLPSLAAL